MAAYWVWWILAGGLVAAELLTGTFYLLAVGVAFAVGGVAAWLGASGALQLAVAAVAAIAGTFVAHRWRTRHATPAPEVPFDVGQAVEVQAWNADGSARVAYRGSLWTAELASPDTPRAQTMYIVATRGSTLVVADRRP
ncbi:MAG: NfeD family protein [Betaproteobacteria bacterium]|jgi:membrane protein implicated in regulation of membrane protease activity|nr:NfeD family protein [Betaproteobacteria bacterium]